MVYIGTPFVYILAIYLSAKFCYLVVGELIFRVILLLDYDRNIPTSGYTTAPEETMLYKKHDIPKEAKIAVISLFAVEVALCTLLSLFIFTVGWFDPTVLN
jgi:hypothetical protein